MSKKISKISLIAIMLSICVVFAACSFNFFNEFKPASRPNGTLNFVNSIKVEAGSSFSDIAEKLLPAAVSIVMSNGTESYLGSGIAVAPSAIIATNYHVIQKQVQNPSFSIKIAHNGDVVNLHSATLLWHSSATDTALVKCSCGDMPFAEVEDRTVFFEEKNKLRVVEDVITIGTPLDLSLQNTITKGAISQLNRTAVADARFYEDLIQHDSSISPGNSGGALIDKNGKVIGLNTLARTDDLASGLFYAVPITPIISVLPNVIDSLNAGNNSFKTPQIGISGYDKKTEATFDKDGLYIAKINNDSCLINKGVYVGDVIVGVKIDNVDYAIKSRNDLFYALYRAKKGDSITIYFTSGLANILKNVDVVLNLDGNS